MISSRRKPDACQKKIETCSCESLLVAAAAAALLLLLMLAGSAAGPPPLPRALLLSHCLKPIPITRLFAPLCRAWQGRLRVGVLPVALFCDGYPYFHKVRSRLQRQLGDGAQLPSWPVRRLLEDHSPGPSCLQVAQCHAALLAWHAASPSEPGKHLHGACHYGQNQAEATSLARVWAVEGKQPACLLRSAGPGAPQACGCACQRTSANCLGQVGPATCSSMLSPCLPSAPNILQDAPEHFEHPTGFIDIQIDVPPQLMADAKTAGGDSMAAQLELVNHQLRQASAGHQLGVATML